MGYVWVNFIIALVSAPLCMGIINRTKAWFSGRKGQPLFQYYYDTIKLWKKGSVYSQTTTGVFQAAPWIGLMTVVGVLLLIPQGSGQSCLWFSGDIILIAYLLATIRWWMVMGSLDTGSSFEGMGASREVQFALWAEPCFFVAMLTCAHISGMWSLQQMYSHMSWALWGACGYVLLLVVAVLCVIMLVENSRMPFDDPNTHLELTMIHEVMVLDYSGPDFGAISYTASLKLWILGSLVVGLVFPVQGMHPLVAEGIFLFGMGILAIGIGVIESLCARVRLLKVSQVLMVTLALAVLGFLLSLGIS